MIIPERLRSFYGRHAKAIWWVNAVFCTYGYAKLLWTTYQRAEGRAR